MADLPVHTPATEHEPPSLPASPSPKRIRNIEPAANLSVASILNDDSATPTPPSPKAVGLQHSTMASAQPPAAPVPAHVSLPSMNLEPSPPALQIKLLSDKGQAPTRGSAFAAGYDLYSAQDTVVPARGKVVVDTDISIAVPAETYGRVAPRSGLAAKHSIDVGAGVIDADYRGPLKVLLFNLGEQDFAIKHGDRIAQLIIERIYNPEVAVVAELPDSVRGAGGFGSTGGFAGNILPPLNGA
ncbi:dUTPase-like protein [Delphinella strobiligena]|nr:dUTPase-like protein [Delphinella strobiligena]